MKSKLDMTKTDYKTTRGSLYDERKKTNKTLKNLQSQLQDNRGGPRYIYSCLSGRRYNFIRHHY